MDEFPDDVRRFLDRAISSVYQVEALLLLRATPERGFRASEVARAIYTDASAVQQKLADLKSHGLLRTEDGPEPRYYYSPDGPELARLVDQLAETYKDRRVSVIAQIYSSQSP